MFGAIKESIFNDLEQTSLNENEKVFKKKFNAFFNVLKENKELKEFYEIYKLFEEVNFDDSDIAKEFVEESLKYLDKFDKKQINKLKTLTENVVKLNENSTQHYLDQLLFNENLSIKDRVIIKTNLTKSITNRIREKANYVELIDKMQTKINENLTKLNEQEKEILELFVEQDQEKISKFYQNLIKETEEIVENKILEAPALDVVKKLVEVKKRLNDLKQEQPTISEIEKISVLKNSF